MVKLTAAEKREQATYARETLERLFPMGSDVHTMVVHQTGYNGEYPTDWIAVLAITSDGGILNVSHVVAQFMGERYNVNRKAVRRVGGGTNLSHDLVYHMTMRLYGLDNAQSLTQRTV